MKQLFLHGRLTVVALLLTLAQAGLAQPAQHALPLVKPASDAVLQGFIRIINHSNRDGTVHIHGIDDSGERFGPVTLEMNAKASQHLNSDDLESGNDDKGLSEGLGDGDGNWRLELETTLDIEPLAYVRTEDGFVTSMHDLVARGAPRCHHVPFFNPGSNEAQVSLLRLINKSDTENEVTLVGLDDEGKLADGAVLLTLPAGGVRTVSAQELESGGSDLTGTFGDGAGKWHLFVSSEHPVELVNMLRSPTGHLANLSTSISYRNCDPTDVVTPEIERAALVALYNETDGKNWAQSENWLSGRPVGEWYGVTTDAAGRVTGLDLSDNELHGEMPPELGELANLTSLSLAHNALSGEIPPEVGNLVNLTSLDLSWNRLSGSLPSELANLHKLGELNLSGNQIHYVSPELVTSAPPTWKFAGDISEEYQRVLREEMEYARAYFSDRFGIEATAFTVLVGADFEALSRVYRDVVGDDLANYYHPQAKFTYAWVSSSATGGAVTTLMFGTLESDSLSSLKHSIAHEYFHVLQGHLASGFAQLGSGETAWHNNDISTQVPYWLVEGLAVYADHAYTPNRAGRRPFGDRYSVYEDLTWFHLNWTVDIGDLARLEDNRTFITFPEDYAYALSFAASAFLARQSEKDAYVNYWKLLGERPIWQQAFEEAFGTEVNDFYNAFNRWLPSQLLPHVQLRLQMRWPDMENQPQSWRFLYLDVEWENDTLPGGRAGYGWTGLRGLPLHMIVTYNEGTTGTGYLSLWWSDDQCTVHLLGWYKDGELTSRREDATPVEFTGRSTIIDWYLPGHPDTLPHLEEGKRTENCQ